MSDRERIKTQYRRFAENECKGYSDHYFGLAQAVADDDDLVEFIAQMPVTQPNLFLASIQFLTGLAPPTRPPRFLLGRTSLANGIREDELLALAHPHGAELEWLARCKGDGVEIAT